MKRRILAGIVTALGLGLLAGCAAGRPTSLIRLLQGYEVLTAHCEARPPESCTPVRVTGDPRDEEAWGFRARPAVNALWKEPEVYYAVGDRTQCDRVRAVLGTPTEECWGPVYFRRRPLQERRRDRQPEGFGGLHATLDHVRLGPPVLLEVVQDARLDAVERQARWNHTRSSWR